MRKRMLIRADMREENCSTLARGCSTFLDGILARTNSWSNMIAHRICFTILGLLELSFAAHTRAHENATPLRVYGNTTTIELAPVLLASDRLYAGRSTVTNGGIPNLFVEGEADIATN